MKSSPAGNSSRTREPRGALADSQTAIRRARSSSSAWVSQAAPSSVSGSDTMTTARESARCTARSRISVHTSGASSMVIGSVIAGSLPVS